MMHDITVMKKIELVDEIINLKEKILSKIAHEFKTPLICVIALSEEIQNDLKSSKKKKEDKLIKNKISHVIDFCNYTLLLINDLAQYLNKKPKRIETDFNKNNQKICERENFSLENNKISRKLSLNYEEVNVIEVLEFCFRILETLLIYNKNKIKFIKPLLNIYKRIEDIKIKTDPIRLKQIILNLISNAVKFTKNGNITLLAKLEGENLLIEVSDTGVGIKPENLKQIFVDFKMLDEHFNMNHLGSGLGLSISKNLAEQMGYQLYAQSQPEIGTTFSLLINLENSTKKPSLITEAFDKNKKNYSSTIVNLPFACEEYKNRKKIIVNQPKKYHSTAIVNKKKMTLDNFETFSNIDYMHKNDIYKYQSNFIKTLEEIPRSSEVNLINLSRNNRQSNSSLIDSERISSTDSNKTVRKLFETNTKSIEKIIKQYRHNTELRVNQFKRKNNIFNNTNPLVEDKICYQILIVDDNMLILNHLENLIQRILKENNLLKYRVIRGFDGVDMLKYIVEDQKNNNSIKCVFADENMEYMNGSEAIKIIKSFKDCNKIKPISIVKFSCEECQTTITNKKGEDMLSLNKPARKSDLIEIFKIVGIIKSL